MKSPAFSSLPILLLIAVVFSSCTFLNNPSQKIHFATNIEAERVSVNERSTRLNDGQTSFDLDRGKDPLVIAVQGKDSMYKVSFNSRNSLPYLYDVVFTAGLASLIEKDNPKRYGQRRYIYLEEKDHVIRLYRFAPNTKGQVNVHFSLPYVNYLHMNTTYKNKDVIGFLGLSAGADYFYKQNTYVSIQGGAAVNILTPFPAPVKYGGKHAHAYNLFAALRHGHTLRSFDLGYGLSLAKYSWEEHDESDPLFVTKQISSSALGLSLTAHYRITKNFRVGILYQPSFLTWNESVFNTSDRNNYQHLYSLEFLFKFRVRQGR